MSLCNALEHKSSLNKVLVLHRQYIHFQCFTFICTLPIIVIWNTQLKHDVERIYNYHWWFSFQLLLSFLFYVTVEMKVGIYDWFMLPIGLPKGLILVVVNRLNMWLRQTLDSSHSSIMLRRRNHIFRSNVVNQRRERHCLIFLFPIYFSALSILFHFLEIGSWIWSFLFVVIGLNGWRPAFSSLASSSHLRPIFVPSSSNFLWIGTVDLICWLYTTLAGDILFSLEVKNCCFFCSLENALVDILGE